jgi:solute carrier family 50 protein (sugar transporter)
MRFLPNQQKSSATPPHQFTASCSHPTLTTMALAFACSITAIVLYLSPLPLLRQIQRERTTKSYSILPLAATTLNGLVWAWYGWLTSQYYPMFVVNGIGSLLGAAYVAIFCRHASSLRGTVITLVSMFLATAFVMSTYVLAGSATVGTDAGGGGGIEAHPHQIDGPSMTHNIVAPSDALRLANRVGLFGVVVGTCMFAAPFATVRQVLKTKSADSLPFPIIFVNLLNGILWTLYGLQLHDAYVIGPNVLGFICAALQLALHQRYSNYWCIRHFDSQKRAQKVKEMQKDIVNPFSGRDRGGPRKQQKDDLEVEVVEKGGGNSVNNRGGGGGGSSGLFGNSNGFGSFGGDSKDLLSVLRV